MVSAEQVTYYESTMYEGHWFHSRNKELLLPWNERFNNPHLHHCCYLSYRAEIIPEEEFKCLPVDLATCPSILALQKESTESHTSLWSPWLRRHLLQTDLFVSCWVLAPGARQQHGSLLSTQVLRIWVIRLRYGFSYEEMVHVWALFWQRYWVSMTDGSCVVLSV